MSISPSTHVCSVTGICSAHTQVQGHEADLLVCCDRQPDILNLCTPCDILPHSTPYVPTLHHRCVQSIFTLLWSPWKIDALSLSQAMQDRVSYQTSAHTWVTISRALWRPTHRYAGDFPVTTDMPSASEPAGDGCTSITLYRLLYYPHHTDS